MPRPRGCAQARDLGYASAAVLAQLAPPPLLRRLELASDKVLRARGTLAPRADVANGAGGSRHGVVGFSCLPHAVALHILSFVPADARARAALVCRAWRVTAADARLWTVLDLSPASGVAQPVTDATLRGAAALARGGLTALCLDDCRGMSHEAQLEVVTANASSLRELSCMFAPFITAHVEELSGAAPHLVAFKADVCYASVALSTRMLRNEVPFGALQLRRLRTIGPDTHEGEQALDEAEVLAFCAAVSAHASLSELHVFEAPLDSPAVIDSLFASALAVNLRDLDLPYCNLSPASVPALVRLIQGGALENLYINNGDVQLLNEATAVQLADAVAASRTLTRLKLAATRFWHDAPAVAVIMHALTGHPRLQEVDLSSNYPPDERTAGAALGALVAANAPALQLLDVSWSQLGDVGLGGLCDALPQNTYLRELKLKRTGMTVEFARHTLLPSVRANLVLRKLEASPYWGVPPWDVPDAQAPPEVLEAEALVAARNNDGD